MGSYADASNNAHLLTESELVPWRNLACSIITAAFVVEVMRGKGER